MPTRYTPAESAYIKRWRRQNPKKRWAHSQVERAVLRGRLIRESRCSVCGKEGAVAHHDDYDKPLDVRWLCQADHRRWHEAHGEGANASTPIPRRAESSRFVGVRLTARGAWRAEVIVKKRTLWTATFVSEVEAARARDAASLRIQGASARLNFPGDAR